MRRSSVIVLAAVSALLGACSLLTDTNGLSSGGVETKPDGGGSSGSTVTDAAPGGDGALPGTVDPAPAVGCPAAGRSCVADAPTGWTGPLLVFDGAESQVPICPASMNIARVDAHRGFHDPPVSMCTECKCLPGSGVTCTATVGIGNNGCMPTSNTVLSGNACGYAAPGSSYIVTTTSTGGQCSAIGGFVGRTAIPWDATTRACGAEGLLRTGCGDGKVCAPDPPTPFKAKHCVSRTGDVDCPGNPYTEKLVANDVDDKRSCTTCTCGPPENNCKGTARTYASGACTGASTSSFSIPSTCKASTGGTSINLQNVTSITPSCTPNGVATPTGTVAASAPTTICCAP